jgi:hypothetical protein
MCSGEVCHAKWFYQTSYKCKWALSLRGEEAERFLWKGPAEVETPFSEKKGVESLPRIPAHQTTGGRYLLSYLRGYCSLDDLIDGENMLSVDYEARSFLGEMSLTVAEMKEKGNYGEPDDENIQVFNDVVTDYILDSNNRLESEIGLPVRLENFLTDMRSRTKKP